jgi:hypothetical protein
MKRKILLILCCFLAFACKKNESVATTVLLNVDLADGTHGWVINADTYGSSVENFENAKNNLRFSLNRATETPEEEKWTWSEIIVSTENADWNEFSGIEITYRADKNLSIILSDSGLQQYNPAAGHFAVLPISQSDTTITLEANNPEHFKQHDWVFYQFPDIRRTIDNSKLYGIKIGTKAIGETTDATISKFVLKGGVAR